MSALVKLAWSLRPVTFGVAAWQSIQDGPAYVGAFGSVVLLGLLAVSYLPGLRRRKATTHLVMTPVPGQARAVGRRSMP